jgi:hypothetical protein
MQTSLYGKTKGFSTKKVSVTQAIKVLKRNGIEVGEDQAALILDFLYLLAKTFKSIENTEGNVPTA